MRRRTTTSSERRSKTAHPSTRRPTRPATPKATELDDESIDEREWKETPTPGHYADNPWARVMEAARRGRGILLYPGEVERLGADADFARRAREHTRS